MSAISQMSISRPVLAGVMSVLLILFGIVGYTFLGTREYPVTDSPTVTVTTVYPGASADIIASQVTKPLEEAIAEANGIRSLSSVSREQVSIITVEFNLNADLEAAANDVRDKVSKSRQQLPVDIEPTIVEKSGPPDFLVFLQVQSDTKSLEDITDFVNINIKERLQSIPGVRLVYSYAERKRAMRLQMDPVKLSSYGLSPADVQAALQRENVDLPSGRIEGQQTEMTLRTLGRLVTEEDFNNMIIREKNGAVVHFRDVGQAIMGSQNERTAMIVANGITSHYGVGTGVLSQRGANSLAIVDEFNKRFKEIVKTAPKEYQINLGKDYTAPVRNSLSEVEETLVLAFGLVAIIIFIFLRDWRSTLIPLVAIPVSIISAFFIMYIMNYSINVLTLLGLVLAIGLVVDDAIVVLENIYSKVEAGMTPLEAARKGSNEIYFAIISTTVTLAAVFLPIMFLGGITGKLFREFVVVVAGSVVISAFVALTLSPMMSAYLLKAGAHHNWLYRKTEPFFVKLNNGYESLLEGFMRHRWLGFGLLLLSFGITWWLTPQLPSELAPLEDRSMLGLVVIGPEGASFESMEASMKEISNYVADSIPDQYNKVSYSAVSAGVGSLVQPVNTGYVSIYLEEPHHRKSGMTQQQVYEKLVAASTRFHNVLVIPIQLPTISGSSSSQPIEYVVQAPDLKQLIAVMPKLTGAVGSSNKLRFVNPDFKVNRPEISISIDRQRAAQSGISTQEIGRSLQLALSGRRYGYFIYNGRQYEVIGQLERAERSTPGNLRSIFLKSSNNEMVPLDNLVSLQEGISPPAIYRYNQSYSVTIQATPALGISMGEALNEMDRITKATLPPGFSTTLAGQSRDYKESSSSLVFAFIFAIVLIYLVLAAQFESLVDPFIILLTVPMAVTGALISLWVSDSSINIFSQIGMIMLIGLITKNGILIVEFANQRKKEGLSIQEAVISAAASRFRPILMTTLAMIFGALPIALSLGNSSGSRASLGIVVVGGLVFAGILTLFVIPAVYSYFSRKVKPAHALNFLLLFAALTPFVGNAQQEKSIGLSDAVQLAKQYNRTLKANAMDISIAGEQVRAAKSLSLPAAELGARYLHYFALPAFFGFGPTGNTSKVPYERFGGRDQFSGVISASYPLYNPIAAPTRKAAQLQEQVSRELYRQSAIDVMAGVQQTYLGILVLAERLKLQQESLLRNEKALADARSLLAQGRGLRVDTLRAYTAVETLKPDLLKLNYAIEIGKQQLITLMGMDSLTQITLTDSLVAIVPTVIPAENELYGQALQQRPDLQVLLLQQQLSEQQTALAKAARLPVVSAVAQYQLQTQTHQFDFIHANWPSTSFAGAQVVLPLFTGFNNQAKIRQAELAHTQSAIRVTEAQQGLKTMVKQVIAHLNETHDRMQTQWKVKKTAVQGYDIVQYRYAKGVTSRLDLTDAELALTAAQLNYLEAVFDYRSAVIELARISGNEGLIK